MIEPPRTFDVGREITIAAQPDTLVYTASALIGAVADVHVNDDGRVYVSDPQANGVHVFDASGRHVRTIGREGEGPGEFRRLGGLQTLGDTLVVVDGGNGRLQLLSLNGEPLATRPVAVGYYGFTVGPNGLMVRSTLGIDSVLAVAYGMDGKERMRLGEVLAAPPARVNLSAMKREIANGDVPAVFLNDAQSAVDDSGQVWLYMTAAAQVERYDPAGVRVLSVQLAQPEFDAVRTRFVSELLRVPLPVDATSEISSPTASRSAAPARGRNIECDLRRTGGGVASAAITAYASAGRQRRARRGDRRFVSAP